MSMNLEALTFKVETQELKDAVTELGKLGSAVKALATPIDNLKKASAGVSQSVEQTGDAAEKTSKKVKKIKEAVEDTVDPLEKLWANLKLTQKDLADGFTRGESSVLKLARSLGATDSQLKEFKVILQEIAKLFKDPFDSAIGSVRSITKEFDALSSRATLAQQGITLTTKQLREYSRLKDEVEAKMSAGGFENNSPETIARIQREQAEYIKLALNVNKLTSEEKERQRLGKQFEKQQLENLKMGDQMVALFRKQEQTKQEALQDTADLMDRIARKTQLIQQGYSSGEANTFMNLQDRGLTPDQINKYISVQRQANDLERESSRLQTSAAKAAREKAGAVKYLADLEQRLNMQMEESNSSISPAYVNQLAKVKRMIELSGMEAEQAAILYAKMDTQIRSVSSKQNEAQMRNLARAMSVQMGDVGISLASGMNPLLVMIQQGDQIRGAIEQAKLEGIDLSASMNNAAKQIAEGFVNTGKAVGGFFVGAIRNAGEAATNFGVRILGIAPSLESWKQTLTEASLAGDSFATKMLRVMPVALSGFGSLILSAVVAIGALAIAFFKVNSEQNEMAKSLALTNGAMGMTSDAAYGYARAMDKVVGTTGQSLEVLSEMGKTGVLTSAEIGMVTEAAINLEKYGGVAIEDTVKAFAKLKEDPYDALVKIAKATGMVSLATVQTVYELEKQGKTFEAQQVALNAYSDVTKAQTERMRNDYTLLGKAVMGASEAFGELFDSVKNLFRKDDPRKLLVDQLENAQKNKKNSFFDSHKEYWGEVEKGLSKQILMMDEVRSREQAAADQKRQALDLQKKFNTYAEGAATKDEKYAREQLKLTNEFNEAKQLGLDTAGVEAKLRDNALEYAKSMYKENDKAQKQTDKAADSIDKKFNSVMKRLTGETNSSVASTFELSKAYKLMLDIFDDPAYATFSAEQRVRITQALQEMYNQEELRGATEARTKSEKEYFDIVKEEEKHAKSYWENVVSSTKQFLDSQKEKLIGLQEEATLIEYQNGLVAMSSEERARLVKLKQAELQYTRDIAEIEGKTFSSDSAKTDALLKAASIYRQRMLNINTEVAMDIARKLETDVANAIETALFEGGSAGKKKLRDIIVAELRKPITLFINAVVNTVMGGLTGSSGGSTIANMASSAGGSSLMGAVGGALGLAGVGSAFGSSLAAGFTSTFASGFSTLGLALEGGLASIATGTATSVAAGLGQIAGAIGSVALPVAAILNVFGVFRSKKIVGSGLMGTLGSGNIEQFDLQRKGGTLLDGPEYSIRNKKVSEASDQIQYAYDQIRKSVAGMADSLGLGTEAVLNFTTSLGSDKIHPDLAQKGLRLDKLTPEEASAKIKEALETASEEMAAMILGAATSTTEVVTTRMETVMVSESGRIESFFQDVTSVIVKETEAVGVSYAKIGETSLETLNRLSTSIVAINSMFSDLGFALKETSLAGADAASKFADLFGGLSEASSALSAYYENYYSEEERVANTTRKLTEALSALGISMPEDRNAFKDIVDDAMSSGNEELAAQLIKLSNVFAELNPAIQEVTETMRDLLSESRELEIELMTLQGRTDEAKAATRALAIEGMTAAEIAIYDYNEGLRDQISAIKKAQDVAEAMSDIQIRLLKAQGKETEALAIERAKERAEMQALDPVLAQMLDTLYAAEDASAAADAAKEVADAWKDTTDSILEEVARIRGLSDTNSVGTSQAKFNAAIAAANSGDIDAANSLPALSQALLDVAGSQAGSLLELRRIEAMTASALEGVVYGIGGESINSTLNSTPAQLQVQQSSATSSASTGAQMIDELKKLRTEVEGLRAEVRSDATHNAKTSKLLERVVRDGETVQVTVVT